MREGSSPGPGMARELRLVVHATANGAPRRARAGTARGLGDLPAPLLEGIVGRVGCARAVLRLEETASAFGPFTRADRVWRDLTLRDFPVPPGAAPASWRELYRFNHKWLREVLLSDRLQETLDRAYPRWNQVVIPASSSGCV